jgi:hypothetical protein
MATQIIAILCEGPHDVVFLSKIVKTLGYKSNEKLKIGQFPSPINELLKTEVSKSNIEDLNLQEVRQALLPINTLEKNNDYLFLYSLGGDGKKIPRQQIVKDFLSFIPKEGEINLLPENTQLSILYFLDSDDKGIAVRINELNQEIEELLGERPFQNHKEVKIINNLKLGTFIFSGEDNNNGKLEDILLPLMQRENEIIFTKAIEYLDVHFDDNRLFPLQLKQNMEGDILIDHRSTRIKDKFKYDKQKSLIGIVGQLQKSGSSNVVCIGQTDYLTKLKIETNPKCLEITEYLTFFLDYVSEN